MKRFQLHFLTALAAGVATSPECGPFFPDSVLDLPQAALRVRATCLLDEMVAIDRSLGLALSRRPAGLAMLERTKSGNSFDGSIPHDKWERREILRTLASVIAAGIPAVSNRFGEEATRRHRGVWAAWMLAKTSPDEATGLAFHRKVIELVVERLKEYFHATCAASPPTSWSVGSGKTARMPKS